jgi:hypothetical protein
LVMLARVTSTNRNDVSSSSTTNMLYFFISFSFYYKYQKNIGLFKKDTKKEIPYWVSLSIYG